MPAHLVRGRVRSGFVRLAGVGRRWESLSGIGAGQPNGGRALLAGSGDEFMSKPMSKIRPDTATRSRLAYALSVQTDHEEAFCAEGQGGAVKAAC